MKRIFLTLMVVTLMASSISGSAGGSVGSSIPGTGWNEVPLPDALLEAFGEKDHARYLVLMDAQADLSDEALIANKDTRRIAVVDDLKAVAANSQAPLLDYLGAMRLTGKVSYFESRWIANVVVVESTRDIAERIASRPEVSSLAENKRIEIIPTPPADASAADVAAVEWNITKVEAPSAWAAGIDGSGVVVANIDTGADWLHPAISSQYRGAAGVHDYNWWDATTARRGIPYDDNAHGTHTMGTTLGGDGLGPNTNDIGVAPGAKWIAVKAFYGGGYGYGDELLAAGQWLAAPTRIDGTGADPTKAPDVVNNSWGGGGCNAWYNNVLNSWRALSIFPAFAAGNSGPGSGSLGAPGDSALAVAVGATDINDNIAGFSSRGPSCYGETKPEVSAPGVNVRSSVPGGSYSSFNGTSMATPHVAGAVALMQQAAGGTLTVDQSEETLRATALDLGVPGMDNNFGAGRINVWAAVQLVTSGGALVGTITDIPGQPISGADVTLVGADRTIRTLSRDNGTYGARAVAGSYNVTATAFGYFSSSAQANIVEGATTTVNFSLEQAPQATISGRVTTANSSPVAGASVRLTGTPLAPAITAPDGTYSIIAPAGIYSAVASASNRCLANASATIDSSGGNVTQDFVLSHRADGFGYICQGRAYTWESGLTRLNLGGDDSTLTVGLPFSFPFYGQARNQAVVDTNGYISFGPNFGSTYGNQAIPSAGYPNAAVFALWDDLYVTNTGGIYTATLGSTPSRRFIFEYRNVNFYSGAGSLDFAIVLHETTGLIELRYKNLGGVGVSSATLGLENFEGSVGFQYSFNEASVAPGTALRFIPGEVGFLVGQVTSAVDGLPVAGATISAGSATATTSAEGRYLLPLVPGERTASVVATHFEGQSGTGVIELGEQTILNFSLRSARGSLTPAELIVATTCDTESGDLTLTSTGLLPLNYTNVTAVENIITDLNGDTAGSVDLVSMQAGMGGGAASFVLNFSPITRMGDLAGVIRLDVDRNPVTGGTATQLFGLPTQTGGHDYYLDLFNLSATGKVAVWTYDGFFIGFVPALLEGQRALFSVPLGMLGNDDGEMGVTASLGNGLTRSDHAPEVGSATLGGPGWFTVGSSEGQIAPGDSAIVPVVVQPSDHAGDTRGAVLIDVNDPRRAILTAVVTRRSLPHTVVLGSCTPL